MLLEQAHKDDNLYFRGVFYEYEIDILNPKVGVFIKAKRHGIGGSKETH